MNNFFKLSIIKKNYGDKVILQNINFKIHENNIIGLIGVNGAGKSTLLKCIAGINKFQGEVTYVTELKSRTLLGSNMAIYIPDIPVFYSYMTGSEYLEFCSKVFYDKICTEKIHFVCQAVGLTKNDCHCKIFTYSRGMKQRLMIAQSLMCKTKLVMFDEPTTAVDPIGKIQIIELIKKMKDESTVIISSHEIEEILDICDYIIVIDKGQIRYFDTKAQFLKTKHNCIEVSLVKALSKKVILELMSSVINELDIEIIGKNMVISGDIDLERQIKIEKKLLENNLFFHEFKINYNSKTRLKEILYE